MKYGIMAALTTASLLIVAAPGNAARAPHSITWSQYQSIHLGASASSVISRLGSPENRTASSGSYGGNQLTLSYVKPDAPRVNGMVLPIGGYTFYFTNGHLDYKTAM